MSKWFAMAGVCVCIAHQAWAATTTQIDDARAKGIAWLVAHQSGTGAWYADDALKVQSTALTLEALMNAGVRSGRVFSSGVAWLSNAEARSTDAKARKIAALAQAGVDTKGLAQSLLNDRPTSMVQSWGAYPQYQASYPDTPLAMGAVRVSGYTYAQSSSDVLNALACELLPAQRGDGGWAPLRPISQAPASASGSAILPTAYAVMELVSQAAATGLTSIACGTSTYNVSNALLNGVLFLLTKKNPDNGFGGNGISTPLDTALAYLAIKAVTPTHSALGSAHDYLLTGAGAPANDGGWRSDPLTTAMVLKTLPGTALADSDADGIPDVVETTLNNGSSATVVDGRNLVGGNGQGQVGVHAPLALQATRYEAVSIDLKQNGYSGVFSVLTGSLPQGLTLSTDGVISGTTPVFGEFPFSFNTTTGPKVAKLSVADEDEGRLLTIVDSTVTATGFKIRFNRRFDPEVLNLYSSINAPLGAADISLKYPSGLAVVGNVILDTDLKGLTFLKTKGSLSSGITYTVRLDGRSDGFVDMNGYPMDGDGDGQPGGNYTAQFTANNAGAVVSIDEIARGPGQPVNLPAATGSGIPVTLTNGAGVTRVEFTLKYNPALLEVTGVSLGSGVPADSSLTTNLSTPGEVEVSLFSPTPMASTATEILRIQSTVPLNAPYGSAHLLALSNLELNDGAIGVVPDEGLHCVAYIGDTSKSLSYSMLDVTYVQRALVRLDNGFGAYRLVDPVVIANVRANNSLSGLDIRMLYSEILGLDRPEIPPIPNEVVPQVPTGPLRVLSFASVSGVPGSVLTVPVSLSSTDGLMLLEFKIAFDPTKINAIQARPASGISGIDVLRYELQPGLVLVFVRTSDLAPLGAGSGQVMEIDFQIAAGVNGVVPLDVQWSAINESSLVVNPMSQPGQDGTDGAIEILPP